MSAFRFAEPQWAYLLWALVAFVILLFGLEWRGAGALDRFLSTALQARLVQRPGARRRRLRILLLGLAGVFLIGALMRPQGGLRHIATPSVGAELMICLDVSNSMLAEDVAPNRLERAKAEIRDLLTYLEGNQVGLIGFAGRATVLSPLTPDFGFLRLVLDGAGPHSVARGGTRLEEPIRKAVAGFGAPRGASRAILLITDGEDHDSFPLDAAKAATEAGIRIIAIGFGDEAGSEIYVTDPGNGARTLLRDEAGRPVRSRLDGDLLRELALVTEGVYVPAGTGVLDLESIFEEHIARLTLGELDPRGKPVRDELYQWAILLGLLALLASAAISAGSRLRAPLGLLLALGLTFAAASAPRAQEADTPDAADAGTSGAEATEREDEAPPLREVYNRGVAALEADDLDAAERWLSQARREARGDGELRFRATYNLGWLAVRRAEAQQASEPEDALRRLHEAATWFRDAVQQRPEHADARANLEVALRRALLLTDRLAQQDPKDLAQRVGEIAKRERSLVEQIGVLVQALATESDPHAVDRFRREFRAHATVQRTVLSDSDRLAAEVAEEQEALEARPEEELTPEDRMRAVERGNLLHYLHRARERMGHARGQLRQRQAQRAYRRASAALEELKRAQDQLRDPVAVLGALIGDALELVSDTGRLAAGREGPPGPDQAAAVPAWLSVESLREHNASLSERVAELELRLRAGLESDGPVDGVEGEELLEALREATPLVAAGQRSFARAGEALGLEDLESALAEQQTGLASLSEAREPFLDLRGLIEAVYAAERRIRTVLSEGEDKPIAMRTEFLSGLRAAQQKNLTRSERLQRRLEREAVRLEEAPSAEAQSADPESLESARQRLELALQILALAGGDMEGVGEGLGPRGSAATATGWAEAREAASRAVERLEALRRLFFSIVEQVRELLERQLRLTDETRDAATLAAPTPDTLQERLAPLVERQQELAARTGEVAWALEEQSRRQGGDLVGEANPDEATRRLREAGEHVLLAQEEMEAAAAKLEDDTPGSEDASEHQGAARAELEQALELLVPPEAAEDSENSDRSEGGGGQGEPEATPQSAAERMDPAQLLQQVREREAQRHRERERRQRAGYESVEKDW